MKRSHVNKPNPSSSTHPQCLHTPHSTFNRISYSVQSHTFTSLVFPSSVHTVPCASQMLLCYLFSTPGLSQVKDLTMTGTKIIFRKWRQGRSWRILVKIKRAKSLRQDNFMFWFWLLALRQGWLYGVHVLEKFNIWHTDIWQPRSPLEIRATLHNHVEFKSRNPDLGNTMKAITYIKPECATDMSFEQRDICYLLKEWFLNTKYLLLVSVQGLEPGAV